MMIKLKDKGKEWRTGYTFDTSDLIIDVTELNAMQRIIVEHEKSPFNKHLLLTKFTENGTEDNRYFMDSLGSRGSKKRGNRFSSVQRTG
nr:arylamine N-acetyltransferase [Halobacillus sp. Marseille-Q1614]